MLVFCTKAKNVTVMLNSAASFLLILFRQKMLFLAALSLFIAAHNAQAAEINSTATVTLSDGLELEELRQLSFGVVLIPSTGTNTVGVDNVGTGQYTSGSETLGDSQQNARYSITGFANQEVSITTSNVVSDIPGVSFSVEHPNSRTLDTNGTANFKVWGEIVIDNTAQAGQYDNDLEYTVTVAYP